MTMAQFRQLIDDASGTTSKSFPVDEDSEFHFIDDPLLGDFDVMDYIEEHLSESEEETIVESEVYVVGGARNLAVAEHQCLVSGRLDGFMEDFKQNAKAAGFSKVIKNFCINYVNEKIQDNIGLNFDEFEDVIHKKCLEKLQKTLAERTRTDAVVLSEECTAPEPMVPVNVVILLKKTTHGSHRSPDAEKSEQSMSVYDFIGELYLSGLPYKLEEEVIADGIRICEIHWEPLEKKQIIYFWMNDEDSIDDGLVVKHLLD